MIVVSNLCIRCNKRTGTTNMLDWYIGHVKQDTTIKIIRCVYCQYVYAQFEGLITVPDKYSIQDSTNFFSRKKKFFKK